MDPWADPDITEMLRAWGEGDQDAPDRFMPLVYEQLRRLARRHLRGEAAGHTLDTSSLVHEAYLRLEAQTRTRWSNRGHFFAIASRTMRRVLTDHARRHAALRRGGGGAAVIPLALDGLDLPAAERSALLIALDEALTRLAVVDPMMARVVECRFFGGLTEEEAAEALGVSRRTVSREWATARGWLWQELHGDVA